MPSFQKSAAIPLGLIFGLILTIITYVTQFLFIYTVAYTIYYQLIHLYQLYEVAWLLATIDLLLDLTLPFSLLLWIFIAVVSGLLLRNPNNSFKMTAAAVLLPGGTWLVFAVKYAVQGGFHLYFLLSFLALRILLPLGLTLVVAGIFSIPYWLKTRYQQKTTKVLEKLIFICSSCGAEYRSKPLVCIQCGSEGTIREKI